MTYEDYKNSKEKKNKKNIISIFLNKLFTIIIFCMLIVIISNYSSRFKNFIINDVLNSTMDFSFVNKIINKYTDVFKKSADVNVSSIVENSEEEYLDGIKYILKDKEEILAKEGGIVTFIGQKEGYNNTIIIQQSNGYYAWYGNISPLIKIYDYVEKGTVIGSASKEYYYALFKDDKKVNIYENKN